jgi:hypothetical protein
MPEPSRVIEIVGEGKVDRGRGDDQPEPPTTGVLPILVHRLCDRPEAMRVRRRPQIFLQGKGLWQKVRFAKRQAFNNGSAGLVYVLDTEGNHPGQLEQLRRGRDAELLEYPAAIGVAHPCLEAWLLADASAIMRAMELAQEPKIPAQPELLPAPCKDRAQNPKSILGRCAGMSRPLSSDETTRIVREIRDLDAIRIRCPLSFVPFASEVIGLIRPIFKRVGNDKAVPLMG